MKRFKSPGQAPRFLSLHHSINNFSASVAITSLPFSIEKPGREPARSGLRSATAPLSSVMRRALRPEKSTGALGQLDAAQASVTGTGCQTRYSLEEAC
jgi:hypothetical protein